jgi:hypothetical protein
MSQGCHTSSTSVTYQAPTLIINRSLLNTPSAGAISVGAFLLCGIRKVEGQSVLTDQAVKQSFATRQAAGHP